MEGTSDFALAMEWYLKYGERDVVAKLGQVEPLIWGLESAGIVEDTAPTITKLYKFKITTKALEIIREHNGANS